MHITVQIKLPVLVVIFELLDILLFKISMILFDVTSKSVPSFKLLYSIGKLFIAKF